MAIPLTDSQRLLRYWDEFQPFSGIDVIEVRGAVDPEKLRVCAEDELAGLRVGFPVASADGLSVSYRSGRPAIAVEASPSPATPLPQGARGASALADHCSAELNRRFQPNVDPLLRMWVVQTAPHPYIGMTWQHWPIDGASGADLFRRILCRFIGHPVAAASTATDLAAPDLAAAFRPWFTWRRKASYLGETIRDGFRSSRIFAAPRPRPDQTSLRVHLLELPYPARPDGATVNDVVAAALIWALSEMFPERQHNLWRRRLNLMNYVDLRPFGGEALCRAWGMFLGFCMFHMPEPRPARWEDLIRSFREQSLRFQESQLFFASLLTTRTLRQHWPWFPRRWRWSLPYRLTPSSAAMTNTRHRGDWSSGPMAEHFGRSWRVAPLGCLVPLIANVCTKGNQLSLALTCEDPGYMSERIEAIKEMMRRLLERT